MTGDVSAKTAQNAVMFESLLRYVKSLQTADVMVDMLQPADPFLETVGEDMRRRIFMSETNDGDVQCLRPEFTIPICLHHCSNANKTLAARYGYGGVVFRQERRGGREFKQVGLEDLGTADIAVTDALSVNNMLQALSLVGIDQADVTLGDQALFSVVVERLQLPHGIAQRLLRNFGEENQITHLIDRLEESAKAPRLNNELEAMAMAEDRKGLIAHVEGLMQQGNLSEKAGRSPDDIAERMIAKAKEVHFSLSSERAEALRRFLHIQAPLDEATEQLKNYGNEMGIDFGTALQVFSSRAEKLKGKGLHYKASFGQKLDYYTGLLFQAKSGNITIARGGRYDRLCSLLGAKAAVPAVGFSISLDRLEEALA